MEKQKTSEKPCTTKNKQEKITDALKNMKLFLDCIESAKPLARYLLRLFKLYQVQNKLEDFLRILMDLSSSI